MVNFTDFLWSYKISVSVQRKCGHLTEILPTLLKSVNGSSFPVLIGHRGTLSDRVCCLRVFIS